MGEKYKKKIGLALGSGSARGWAHIGVLKALQENSIEIHGISGTSIGALVGAIHASGDIGAFEQFVQKLNWLKMLQYLDVTVPIHGLLSGNRIARLFSDHFGQTTIESLKIPFACIATDIEDGTEVIVDRGSIATAVRASVSIPGIFSPVRDQNRFLVDGAVSNPLPVDVCRKMGMDIVIAVNLNHQVATKNSLSAGQSIVSPSESETRILKKLARPYRQQRQHRESRHPKPSILRDSRRLNDRIYPPG